MNNIFKRKPKTQSKGSLHKVFIVIGLFIVFTIISSISTIVFYTHGEPDRIDLYRDVVISTIAVTRPNISLESCGIEGEAYFTTTLNGRLEKQVGGDRISVGEVNMKFLFNYASFNDIKLSSSKNFTSLFCSPRSSSEINTDSHWERLEKLPEGTVAEAYISLDKFYETDDLLKKFKEKDIKPLWFAVDTGINSWDIHSDDFISHPIGFPYSPLWHHDDWIIDNRTEEKGIFFSKIVSELRHSPSLDPYGSGDIRNENFIKTLKLMEEYESIAKRVTYFLDLEKTINYINDNGVKIYGVVLTGPTKEILKLKEENWVKGVKVGEVRLWNWR